MSLTVYLSGEIHTSWRDEVKGLTQEFGLDINYISAVTNHESSDGAGDHLGSEEKQFWRDHKSAKINAIRTKTLLKSCDIAIIRFGQEYKQWNAAFEAGQCAALNIPFVTLHDENIIHPLKEVDAASMAWAKTTKDVAEILAYVLKA
ncbi:YtoQ family protein [Sulfurimonas sp. MAG313]|nr:YtoQ family protein [Sulfurimonas sp. MAG313]MDF1881198.1 YtoQ family protein [Sulfurimonas sp. MAG313]